MSLETCVLGAVKSGKMTKEKADDLLESAFPDDEVIRAALSDNYLKKRQLALEIVALNDTVTKAQSHPDGIAEGYMALINKNAKATYGNWDGRSRAILGGYHAELNDMLNSYKTKKLGFSQNKKGLENFKREMYGENTGDVDAAKFAKEWQNVTEQARIRFNRAGGAILKREDWRFSQAGTHDQVPIQKAGKEQWVNDAEGYFEPFKDADGQLVSPVKNKEILEDIWETLRTGGASKIEPGKVVSRKMGNTRQEQRRLIFKDANSDIAYQKKYGSKDTFTNVNDWLRGISDDTALMEMFGPNPKQTHRYMMDLMKKEGVGQGTINKTDALMREATGMGSIETSAIVGDIAGGTRNLISVGLLGGATLASVADVVTQAFTAKASNMSVFKTWATTLKKFVGGDREEATQLGLGLAAATHAMTAASRFVDVTGKGWTGRLSDKFHRATLLTPWTDSIKSAHGIGFARNVANNLKKSWSDLPTDFRKTFERYGLDEADWKNIQSAKVVKVKGVGLVGQDALQTIDLPKPKRDDLIARYMGMVIQEGDFAAPTPDARSRSTMTLGTQRGTAAGEFVRTITQFKTHPITLMQQILYRNAMREGTRSKVAYTASLMISLTLAGAAAIQLKDLAKGLAPRDMFDDDDPEKTAKFWSAAVMQGGGLGIFGDFLFSETNRHGGGLASTLSGPTVALTSDVLKLSVGNLVELSQGKDTKAASEAIDFAKRWTPGSSIWYSKLILEREIWDQLQLMADPKIRRKHRKMMRGRKKDYDQEYWWKPGKTKPE